MTPNTNPRGDVPFPCFSVRRRDLAARADVSYAAASATVAARYAHPKYPLVPLEKVSTRLQYGTSALATTEPIGLPIVRMNNLQDDEWDFSDLKYVELSEPEVATYRLVEGDLLFNRTNSKELVGKCAVFREPGDWVFASYLIRVQLDIDQALPEFVSAFLGTDAGRAQIDQLSRQIIGMSNINREEIQSIKIPLPRRVDQQAALVNRLAGC